MNHVRQVACGSGQLLMAEGIDIIGGTSQLADITAVLDADTLRNCDNDYILPGQKLAHLCGKLFDVKGPLRQIDQIRSVAVLSAGQCSCTGQPSGIAAHDLYDDHLLFFIREAKAVPDHFFGRGCNVFCGTSIARRMVGQGQVVVNGLRNAHELLGLPRQNCIIRQFFDRVHGIISADINKAFNIQLI